jgi:hypothetical protein
MLASGLADVINVLGRNRNTVKDTEALLGASKDIGLGVNAWETKYIFMSRYQTA